MIFSGTGCCQHGAASTAWPPDQQEREGRAGCGDRPGHGVLTERLGVSIADAFVRLRAYA
jgi:hypothetical protein